MPSRQSRSSSPSRRSTDPRPDRAAAAASAKYDHEIKLVDHTREDDAPEHTEEAEDSGSGSAPSLNKRWTQGSLRKKIEKRKYRKWQDRTTSSTTPGPSTIPGQDRVDDENAESASAAHDASGSGHVDDGYGVGRTKSALNRGRRRVRGIVNPKKAAEAAKNEDAVVDILYENQRGSFFLGIPLFSQKSLLNFDPSPWLNGQLKPSAVNITNAQVPDPSWEWAWKSWFVDMSHDVDEEGWQYSFSFRQGFSWHGTHPWFHSFVRRRRWLRKRVRKYAGHTKEDWLREAHEFNSEYFTIHSKTAPSIGSSMEHSQALSSSALDRRGRDSDDELENEIHNMPMLMKRLKTAAIDREKIVAVKRFVDTAGDELHYLGEYMPAVMSLFVFQSSRRQLLAILMRKFEAANKHRDEHVRREESEDANEKRHIDDLLKAVRAADDQCKSLEYWSDIRDMVQEGETLGGADHGWGHGWQGVDTSGLASNDTTSPTDPITDGDPEVEPPPDRRQGVKFERVVRDTPDDEEKKPSDDEHDEKSSNNDGKKNPADTEQEKGTGSQPALGDQKPRSDEILSNQTNTKFEDEAGRRNKGKEKA